MNFKIVLHVTAALVIITGLFMATSLIPAVILDSDPAVFNGFLTSSAITIFLGLALFFKTRTKGKVRFHEGFAVVSFGWMAISLFGSLPYMLIAEDPNVPGQAMGLADAFFETMSGFTTTGGSILNDIEGQAKAILYWRALTNWLGGMGIVVLSLAILPLLGIGGMQLYKAEVPGPTSDQLTSRIASTAKILWVVYFLLSAILLILLKVFGMNWFDAICHTFATLATGGFSTKAASVGAFSPAIQWIITAFMFLAGCNFVLHIKALQGKPLFYFKDEEFRFYFYTFVGISLLIASSLYIKGVDSSVVTAENTTEIIHKTYDAEEALRAAFFQVSSIITTTGFGTDDFNIWPTSATTFIVLLFFFGGCGGSTAGGLKISRIMLLLKHSWAQIKLSLMPHALPNVRMNETRINNTIMDKVLSFFFLYMFLYICVSIIMCFVPGIDILTAFTSSIACLGNIGPGLNAVGPAANFAWLPDWAKWILSISMLIGRLEIYTVLVLFTTAFWKK